MKPVRLSALKLFTVCCFPFTMRLPFSVFHGERITENALKTVNGKLLTASAGGLV
jgi:hypothetical protein